MNNLGFNKNNYFNGTVVVNGDLDLEGDLSIGGNVDISGAINFHGEINACGSIIDAHIIRTCDDNGLAISDENGLAIARFTRTPNRGINVNGDVYSDHYKPYNANLLFYGADGNLKVRINNAGQKMYSDLNNEDHVTILRDVKAGSIEDTIYFDDSAGNKMVQMETDKTYINKIKAFSSTNLLVESESDITPTTLTLTNGKCAVSRSGNTGLIETDEIRNYTPSNVGTTSMLLNPEYMRLSAVSATPLTDFANISINQTPSYVKINPNLDCNNIHTNTVYQNSPSGLVFLDYSGNLRSLYIAPNGKITFDNAYSFPTSSATAGKVLGLITGSELGFIDISVNPLPDVEITLVTSNNMTVTPATNTTIDLFTGFINKTGSISENTPSNGFVTINVTGYYIATATLGFGSSQFQTRAWFAVNDLDTYRYGETVNNFIDPTGPTKMCISAIIFLNQGSTLCVKTRNTNPVALSTGIGEGINKPAMFSIKLLNQNSLIDNLTVSAPLSLVGPVLSIPQATTSQNGYLSSSDKTAYDLTTSRVNQSVTTTSSPTFANVSVVGTTATDILNSGNTTTNAFSYLNIYPSEFIQFDQYNTDLGNGFGSSFNLTVNKAYYYRIGSLVTVNIWLLWDSKNGTTSTIKLLLPFPVGGLFQRTSCNFSNMSGVIFTGMLTAGAVTGDDKIEFFDIPLNGANSITLDDTSFRDNGELQITTTYTI